MRRKFRTHYLGLIAVGALFTAVPVVADQKQNIPKLEVNPQTRPNALFSNQIAKYPAITKYMDKATGGLNWASLPGAPQINSLPKGCLTCRNIPEEQLADMLIQMDSVKRERDLCRENDAKNWKWAAFEAERILEKLEQKLTSEELQTYLAKEGASNDFEKIHKRLSQLVATYERNP